MAGMHNRAVRPVAGKSQAVSPMAGMRLHAVRPRVGKRQAEAQVQLSLPPQSNADASDLENLQGFTSEKRQNRRVCSKLSSGAESPKQSNLSENILKQEEKWGSTPLFLRLRKSFPFWKKIAPQKVLDLILHGVQNDLPLPGNLSQKSWQRAPSEVQLAQKILEEYAQTGAVKKVSAGGTGHLVPWFVLSKQENGGQKHRLISDCRELNGYFQPKKFVLDHMNVIFPYLKKGQWGAKIDLKDAYFHLELHQALKKFVRLQVGGTLWEFQAACFGISSLPEKFMSLMKALEKVWRAQGIQIFVYLDDILILGVSQKQVSSHLSLVAQDLMEAGFKINVQKSQLEPVQVVTHLGFQLNLKDGKLEVPPHKLKTIRKEIGKVLLAESLSCRKMASILGQVRSQLVALPCLRVLTNFLADFSGQHTTQGWDYKVKIPQDLKTQILELKEFLQPGVGRPFWTPPTRILHSDSSTHGWGGLDVNTGKFIQDFWRQKSHFHINLKELEAAGHTIKSLAKRGDSVLLHVDNTVAFSYLGKQGGRKKDVNDILRPIILWAFKNDIQLKVKWVPSQEMRADSISRWSRDPGDYTLNMQIFRKVLKFFLGGNTPTGGHVCHPLKQKVPPLLLKMAPPPSTFGGRPNLPPRGGCQKFMQTLHGK